MKPFLIGRFTLPVLFQFLLYGCHATHSAPATAQNNSPTQLHIKSAVLGEDRTLLIHLKLGPYSILEHLIRSDVA